MKTIPTIGARKPKTHILRGIVAALFVSSCALWAESATDSQSIAELFYTLNGDAKDPHKKINHAKGFCAVGEFIPVKGITNTYNIPLLKESSIPTQARFSLAGGNPKASDTTKGRGLALKIEGKSDNWEIVMLNTEINFAKNLEEFVKFFEIRVPKNGKVDSENIAKVTKETPSFANYDKYLAKTPLAPSVANTTYYSIHTFYFTDSKGKSIPARFAFVPVAGEKGLSADEAKKLGDDFLESDFKSKTASKPIEYKMMLILANPNDITNDTTALWSGKHKEVQIATLRIKEYAGKDCNGDVYMPAVLPQGVDAPKDPLFETRNEVYGITFGKRQ